MSNMQQYGASKNPPWARNAAGPAIPGMQQQIMSQNSMSGMSGMSQAGMSPYQQTQSQSVYQPNLLQQQNMALGMQMQPNSVGMSTMNQGQMFSQTGVVSYPTPRALNPNAFPGSAIVGGQASNSSPKQRVFTGTVTKAHNDFGFVDEDVFFQTSSCVKGSHPVVGDRVLVEASFNSNMPFKWNATRIQVLPTNKGGSGAVVGRDSGKKSFGGMPNSNYNAVPPPGDGHNGSFQNSQNSGRGQRARKPVNNQINNNARGGGDRGRNRQSNTPRKDDDNADRIRRRAERQEKDSKPADKVSEEKGKSRSLSKQRKRTRPVARYLVQVPKLALDIPEADVLAIRRRYTNLYIPSDFFNTQFRWVDAFPPNSPFTLNKPCLFHVMPKDIDNPITNDTVLEPTDVDYLFSAKVMLLSMPSLDELYRKCCAMATEEKSKDEREFIHPTRLISFLVGLRGKNETMAIGGPWSPSLDGANPATDPTVLIKTAIRTCKAHTGIDLSNCTQWYRFVELYYRRAESVHRGRVVPARVETVVIYVPDVWSCLPTRLEWDAMVPNYAARPTPAVSVDQADKPNVLDTTKKEPTLYSELDTKVMSVTDLRKELWARNISTKGLKSQLIARLNKVLKREEAKEKSGEEMEVEDEVEDVAEVITIEDEPPVEEVKLDEEKQKLADKEKLITKAVAGIPENPHIMVHPSRTAKSGKFDCTVMTLSLLLDYRREDSKEHSFEVSLFAELFNEMLMRDFGFNIYKALYVLPDKPEEDKKKDEAKDKDKKGDDSKDKDTKGDDSKDKDESKDKKEDKKGDDKKDAEKKSDRKRDDKKDSTPLADDDNNSDRRSTSDKKDRKDRPRLFTKDAPLLLSFVYFDTTHCGYIFEKDMEELLYTLGLNLSRAQVRRLVSKVVRSDSFYYRHITDKSKEEDLEAEKNPVPEVAMKETDLSELAAGNKKLLPIFKSEDLQNDSSEPPSKRPRTETAENGALVSYKGGLLDVEKLMNQLKRSEQARLDTESRLVELKSENARLLEKQAKSAQTTTSLTTNLTENKAKLVNTQTQLTKSTMCTKIFFNALKDIELKVQSVIHTNLYDDPEVVKPKGETNKSVVEVPKEGIKNESIGVNEDTTVDAKMDKDSMEVTNEDTKPQIDTNDTNDTN